MADISTLRTLIVLTTFVMITFGMYAIAATESPAFFTEAVTGSGPSQGSATNPKQLLSLNITNIAQVNTTYSTEVDITGWTDTKWSAKQDMDGAWCILVEKYDHYIVGGIDLGAWNFEDFTWYDIHNNSQVSPRLWVADPRDTHIVMPVSILDAIYIGQPLPEVDPDFVGPLPPFVGNRAMENLTFTLTNSKGSMDIRVKFDDSKYDLPTIAVQFEGLFFDMTQDFNDRRTTMNILTFIGGLFVLDPPGVPYPISSILGLFWYGSVAALVYIIFSVVRSLIPFLPGD